LWRLLHSPRLPHGQTRLLLLVLLLLLLNARAGSQLQPARAPYLLHKIRTQQTLQHRTCLQQL
jgi:hypothetical protein